MRVFNKSLVLTLLVVVGASACSGNEVMPDAVADPAPAAAPATTGSGSAAFQEPSFDGRFFNADFGVGQSDLLFWYPGHRDVMHLVDESDLVFVGTLVGSTADEAKVRLVKEPGIDDDTTLIYDGLQFRVDRILSGAVDGDTVIIAHPAIIQYAEGPARIAVEPIELLRPELEEKRSGGQWLIFAAFDEEVGQLTISDGRLVPLVAGVVAEGASGEFAHRAPGTAFETSVDDVDALIKEGTPLPTPQTPDMSREELLEAGVPQGGVRHDENLHGPESPCYGLDDPAKLAQLIADGSC